MSQSDIIFRTTKNAHILLPTRLSMGRSQGSGGGGGGGGGYLVYLRIRVGPKDYTHKKATYPKYLLSISYIHVY